MAACHACSHRERVSPFTKANLFDSPGSQRALAADLSHANRISDKQPTSLRELGGLCNNRNENKRGAAASFRGNWDILPRPAS
jgi:hypothetical protein